MCDRGALSLWTGARRFCVLGFVLVLHGATATDRSSRVPRFAEGQDVAADFLESGNGDGARSLGDNGEPYENSLTFLLNENDALDGDADNADSSSMDIPDEEMPGLGATEDTDAQFISCKKGELFYKGKCRDCLKEYCGPHAGYLKCKAGTYGEYGGGGNTHCRECPRGKFSNAGSTRCETCPGGSFAYNTGSAECAPCEAGKFAGPGSRDCRPCGIGKYALKGASTCKPCEAGKFILKEGASSCTPCARGHFAYTTGSYRCLQCYPGKVQPKTGQSSCEKCASGKSSDTAHEKCLDDTPPSPVFQYGVPSFGVTKGRYAGLVDTYSAYTITFWYKPTHTRIRVPGKLEGVISNVFHIGSSDSIRAPAVWQQPHWPMLHIRVGTTTNADDGCNPSRSHLLVGQWVHVAIVVRPESMEVYYGGERKCSRTFSGKVRTYGKQPLFFSDPWYHSSLGHIREFRMYDKSLREGQVKQTVSHDHDGLIYKNNAALHLTRRGTKTADIATRTVYTILFRYKPTRSFHTWTNIFHIGSNDHVRAPSVWQYYGHSTRLHVRIGTTGNWNDGCDPEEQLSQNQWTNVAIVVHTDLLSVYYDGKLKCSRRLHGHVRAYGNQPLFFSDPWYEPSHGFLSHFQMYGKALTAKELSSLQQEV